MPTVPGSYTPFVPEGLGQNAPTGPMVEKPSPTNLLMAAAMMKDLGRFTGQEDQASPLDYMKNAIDPQGSDERITTPQEHRDASDKLDSIDQKLWAIGKKGLERNVREYEQMVERSKDYSTAGQIMAKEALDRAKADLQEHMKSIPGRKRDI